MFDRQLSSYEKIAGDCARLLAATYGQPFNRSEHNLGFFSRFFGGDELMVTIEYLDHPPVMAVFEQSLGSVYTGILCPEARERLARSRSVILINVFHGVLAGEIQDRFAGMFADIGFPRQGATLAHFRQRLKILANLSRVVLETEQPSVVHWTQSNQLVAGERWEVVAEGGAPGPVHVHPILFGHSETVDGKNLLGLRTFGARHFIGHEFIVEPHEIAWAANYQIALMILGMATMDNGYIIPDGDSIGPEDGSFSYRVKHRPASDGDVPLLELIPLMHREAGFVSPDYVPKERTIDDRSPPPALMPEDDEQKEQLTNEWREKRKLAEGLGGRLEVRARGNAPLPPPNPRPGVFGGRAIFGRKKG
jgi:hypothetical protein